MHILVFGNSGSGKSTLCRDLASQYSLDPLDLDSIVWEPGKIAGQRPVGEILASLHHYLEAHAAWAIEGCYGELIGQASARCTQLVFLNPGRETCLRQNLHRPWEPHKYVSPEAQDAMLANLQAWVSSYYERNDAWSFAAHRALFDSFQGNKVEYTEPATAMLLAQWLPQLLANHSREKPRALDSGVRALRNASCSQEIVPTLWWTPWRGL